VLYGIGRVGFFYAVGSLEWKWGDRVSTVKISVGCRGWQDEVYYYRGYGWRLEIHFVVFYNFRINLFYKAMHKTCNKEPTNTADVLLPTAYAQ
jgi:hypothetical protein